MIPESVLSLRKLKLRGHESIPSNYSSKCEERFGTKKEGGNISQSSQREEKLVGQVAIAAVSNNTCSWGGGRIVLGFI